ncbi:hypothetical protein B566_EDAN006060 [Ephemera danica]|nr:hypothetical protein B566_EDAN006060 [Ephemera danica]
MTTVETRSDQQSEAATPFISSQTDVIFLERETQCGLGPWRPAWLQKLASKKLYVVVYGLIGLSQFALGSYFVATISTMEKRFKIPSKNSGLITSAWDIGVISTSVVVSYLGRTSHKPRWVAYGTMLMAISCYMRLIPHWMYGPGEDAISLTTEFGAAQNNSTSPGVALCGEDHQQTKDCDNTSSGHISEAILFLAQLVVGVGNSVYLTLGISYMDDNARKDKTPIMLAIWQCINMLGPTFGFLIASYALEMYVVPDLTPTINTQDSRWIGAWWFGWQPLGTVMLLLALVMAMFPRSLPRAAQRNKEVAAAKGLAYKTQTKHSLADFKTTVKRLATNKILICNIISSVFFMFGLMGQWVFMPKYMETQFRQSASNASLISGSVGLISSAAGVLMSGIVISRFKPRARLVAGWNVVVEICDMLGYVVMAYISCEALNLQGTPQYDGTCVSMEDKPVSIGMSEFLLCACAFIPSPIVFGILIVLSDMDVAAERRLSLMTDPATAEALAFIPTRPGFGGYTEAELLERETRCGLGPWRPAWLQRLASKKSFVVVYGLIGMVQFALASYFVATISTMEKRFKIPSQTSGLINSAWDVGSVFTSIIAAYLGRSGHKTRWVAWGTFLVAMSCYMRLIPHWIMSLCGNNHTDTEDCDNASSGHISAAILFMAHMVLGIGTSVYYTLGVSYMDDNARKNKAPLMLAAWQCLRMLGPTFGYLLASYALEMYIVPELTPTVDSKDPRWMGAWWFGWQPFGTVTLIWALVMAMFPRSLPRAAQRNVEAAAAKGVAYTTKTQAKRSFSDFKKTLKRLLSNKVLVCNCVSSTCMLFGLIGQWVFMPKYMETQFRQSASTASLISGSVGLLCTAAGVLASASVISRFKPRARLLAGWNVLVELCDVAGFIMIAFIGCEALNLQGNPQPDGTLGLKVECNSECGCTDVLRYAPVCDPATRPPSSQRVTQAVRLQTGSQQTLQRSSCSCVEGGGPVIDGSCPVDCSQAFMLYIIVQCIQRFLGATGRAGNTLIHFRCVSPEDKPVSIGFSEFLLYLSCLVWGFSCGETGNCLLYDVDKLRLYVNVPIVVALFVGTCWDVGVWYFVKGLELYDNDEEKSADKVTPEAEVRLNPDETNSATNEDLSIIPTPPEVGGCTEADLLEDETRCGLGPWRPAWLQRLASKKSFVVVYGLIGMTEFALASYFVATISTIEKRFKIPSQTSGLISSASDIGLVSTTIIAAYLGGSGHKPRWVACSTLLVAFSCYMRLIPHWMYGPGEDALSLTTEFGATGTFGSTTGNASENGPISLCGNNETDSEDCDNASSGHISAAILFLSQMVLGIGNSVYCTLGICYMDDNSRKNKAPLMLAAWQCIRMLGPTFGYLLASYGLEMYIAPELTPTVDSKDSRWMGAWWFAMLIWALLMAMFPRSLPRAAQRKVEAAAAKGLAYTTRQTKRSFVDFKKTLKRLLTNKVLVCNCVSSTCMLFGLIGQWVFMPKYVETQFGQSASMASLITGSVGLLCTAAGVLVSASVISRFKPRARLLAGWNVLVELCDVAGFIMIAFIGCEALNLQGNPQPDGTCVNLSCLVWGFSCGETGNCLLYDVDKLRFYVYIPIVVALFMGTCWDVGVWYFVKGLDIYDDDDGKTVNKVTSEAEVRLNPDGVTSLQNEAIS